MYILYMARTHTTAVGNGPTQSPQEGAMFISIDLSKTVGQTSAIKANGSPIVTIKVTCPAVALPDAYDGTKQEIPGFGRVQGDGPVAGYEVLYTLGSVAA